MNAQELHFAQSLTMRDRGIDLARGFTVALMPAVHVTMLYGNPAVYASWLGRLLNWIAVFSGAQLFMLLMGISFSFSLQKANRPPKQKILILLLTAYSLNAAKFVVPALLNWLPTAFYADLQLNKKPSDLLHLFLVGDILQFAAIAYAIIYFIHKIHLNGTAIMITMLFISFLSPLIWQLALPVPLPNWLGSLVTGNDSLVFFPLFPWLVYPLCGYLLGRTMVDTSINYSHLMAAGIALLVQGIIIYGPLLYTTGENLYRSLPAQTLYHLGFCFCWLSVCHVVAKKVHGNLFFRLINWFSRHITLIYIVQWIIIFWCMAILPYRGLTLPTTIIWILILSLLTVGLTKALTLLQQKLKTN